MTNAELLVELRKRRSLEHVAMKNGTTRQAIVRVLQGKSKSARLEKVLSAMARRMKATG